MGNLDFSANADQLKELAAYMASQINVPTIGIGGGYAPIGTINFFDATVAPQDWLACDGSVYNIADYPQLAEWYATQHGASNFYGGNGTTTFAVPDLQGEFLRGTGTNSHANQGSGASVGEHQDGTKFFGGTDSSRIGIPQVSPSDYETIITNAHRIYTSSSATDENGFLITSRPTNTSFLICVKAIVAGEVYSTEERVVGTWIDGKPLYQKTIVNTIPATSADGTYVTKSIDIANNVDLVCSSKGFVVDAITNDILYLPFFSTNSGNQVKLSISTNRQVILANGFVRFSNSNCYVTVQYTKTTDV